MREPCAGARNSNRRWLSPSLAAPLPRRPSEPCSAPDKRRASLDCFRLGSYIYQLLKANRACWRFGTTRGPSCVPSRYLFSCVGCCCPTALRRQPKPCPSRWTPIHDRQALLAPSVSPSLAPALRLWNVAALAWAATAQRSALHCRHGSRDLPELGSGACVAPRA